MSSPAISVIIPSFNRPAQLQACLASLAAQALAPSQFEVIVVDDGSNPPLNPAHPTLHIQLLRQHNQGPAAARNLAASHARAPYLAFTDDDCRPQPSWLQTLLDAFTSHPNALLGGSTLNQLADNPYAQSSQLIQDFAYAWYNANPLKARFFASNNLALPTPTFLHLGGFNSAFRTAEDRDLCDRYPGPLVFVPTAEVLHAHPLNFSSYLRQHYHYGRGARRFQLAHRQRKAASSILPAFYLSILHALPQTLLRQRRPATIAALLALWQAANAAGFLAEMLQSKRHHGQI